MIIIIIEVHKLFIPVDKSGCVARLVNCPSAATQATNSLELALSQETSDLAETSDHEMLASTGIASLWVVLVSSTEGCFRGSRSL